MDIHEQAAKMAQELAEHARAEGPNPENRSGFPSWRAWELDEPCKHFFRNARKYTIVVDIASAILRSPGCPTLLTRSKVPGSIGQDAAVQVVDLQGVVEASLVLAAGLAWGVEGGIG